MSDIWTDLKALLAEPLIVEGLFVIVLFFTVLLVFRRIRKIAQELERRRALADYVRGLDEFLREAYRPAAKILEKVLERDPENVEARIALGDCYRKRGDPAEAKRHHHHVHKVFGHELARNFLSLGRDELALRNYDKAAEAFQRAVDLAPREGDALAGLAQAYAEGGNPIAAAETLRQLYPHGPAEDLPLARRRAAGRRFCDAGEASLADGDVERAIAFHTEAIAFQPESVRARIGLLRAAHALGDDARARDLVEEHLGALRDLAEDESTLFEPSAARPPGAPGEGAAPQSTTMLPMRIENVGALVAAVDAKTAHYACSHCGVLARDYAECCDRCGSVGTIEALSELVELYTMPISGFREAVDEVEESTAFLQTLARKGSLGDEDAMKSLLGRGPSVLYEVFAVLPGLEARRYLGERLAELGAPAARDVRECHAARATGSFGGGPRPHDEFAAAFYLALPPENHETFLSSLGLGHDQALAGVMADPRLSDAVRDAARDRLASRMPQVLVAVVEAVAASGDFGGVERAARLVRDLGRAGVEEMERRFLSATLLGKLFGPKGHRRKAAADILARTDLTEAADALGRAAAKEKDDGLRGHYLAARERAHKGGGA